MCQAATPDVNGSARRELDAACAHMPMADAFLATHPRLDPPAAGPLLRTASQADGNGTAAVLLYGVLARAVRFTWPYLRRRVIGPLEASGLAIDLLGFDVDPGTQPVDGWVLERDHLAPPSRPGVVPFRQLFSLPQEAVDAKLRRLCNATLPGCDPRRPKPGKTSLEYDPAALRCPPMVAPIKFRREWSEYYAGLPLAQPYSPPTQLNAYRQLHAEARLGRYLELHAPRYRIAVAIVADALPLVDLDVRAALSAADSTPRVLLTPNQNDREGFTNGFLVGHPEAVGKISRRLYDLAARRAMPGVGAHPTSYEGMLAAGFALHRIERRILCMRFVKVRAGGGLDYVRCLDTGGALRGSREGGGWRAVRASQWAIACTPPPGSLPSLPPIRRILSCPPTPGDALRVLSASAKGAKQASPDAGWPAAPLAGRPRILPSEEKELATARYWPLRVRELPRAECLDWSLETS